MIFPHGGNWSALHWWSDLGLRALGDLYDDNALIPFETLRDRLDLPRKDSLLHSALIAAIQKHWGQGLSEPQTSMVCQYVVLAAGTISHVFTAMDDTRTSKAPGGAEAEMGGGLGQGDPREGVG